MIPGRAIKVRVGSKGTEADPTPNLKTDTHTHTHTGTNPFWGMSELQFVHL